MRSDTQRNRRELVNAAGELFAARRGPINMTDIAKHAEISTATAYRHFASVEEVLAEYRFKVGEKLRDYSLKQTAGGLELLEAVSRKWVDLVVKHGGAMLYTRSGEGYLARLRTGAFYLTVQAEALQRPLEEACAELGLSPLGDEAMFLWNILFDPREILDLINTVGLNRQQASARLVAALCGALKGWDQDKASPKGLASLGQPHASQGDPARLAADSFGRNGGQ
ncbi:TetR/AcrR family transcriptional regulator [Arthrobacter sp. BHU FT2]|nr:TetR/AcrR family transcriptional regulator [Arthrobacter sp. BHU FT2]